MTRPARKMKPSGIPWIGDVPADWEICKLKFVVNAFTGNSIKDEEKDFYSSFPLESSHPYIATKDIDKITGRINYESGLRTLKRDTLFKLAPKYSTLLCVEGGSAGEKIAFTEQDVSFVNKLCCFYTSSINKKYLFYFLSSSAFKECFKSFISGLIGGVPVSVFKNFNISIPPTETQKKIRGNRRTDRNRGKNDRGAEKLQAVRHHGSRHARRPCRRKRLTPPQRLRHSLARLRPRPLGNPYDKKNFSCFFRNNT